MPSPTAARPWRGRLAVAAVLLLLLGVWWGWLSFRAGRDPLDEALAYLPADASALGVVAAPATALARMAPQLAQRPPDEQLRIRTEAIRVLGFDPSDPAAREASGLDLERPFVAAGDRGLVFLIVPARSDLALAWLDGRLRANGGAVTPLELSGRRGWLASRVAAPGGPHVAGVLDGRWLVIASHEDPAALVPALQAAFARPAGGSLGEQPSIRRARAEARRGWSALGWLDLARLQSRPEVELPQELAGSALVGTIHTSETEVVLESITTGPIVAKLPKGTQRPDRVAAQLSGRALALARLDVDPRDLVQAAEADPKARRELEQTRLSLRMLTGLELDRDVVQNLVGPFGAALFEGDAKLPFGPAPVVLGWGALQDEAAARAALDRAVDTLQASNTPIRRDSDGLVRIGPAGLMIAHGHLWLGSESTATLRAIEQVAARRGGLLAGLPADSRAAFERAPPIFLHVDTPALVTAVRKTPLVSHGGSDALAGLGQLGALRLTVDVEPTLVRATLVIPAPAGGWGAPQP